MTDVAASAAPAAAPAPVVGASAVPAAPTQGSAPIGSPAPAQAAPAASGERARGPDGKFIPSSGDAAPSVPPETPTQAAARRRLALKVRGEEHALDLDDSTADALARLYGTTPDRLDVALQKDVYGDRAIKEGRQAQEQAKRLIEALRSPESVVEALEALGHDVDALSFKRLQAAAARESMTPEERAFAEREQALAQREARLREIEERGQEQERTQAEQQAFASAQAGVLAALQEHGLPRSHRTIRMVADAMLGAMQAGITLTPAQVAAEVRAELDGLNTEYLGAIPEEALGQRLAPRIAAMPVERLVAMLGPRLRDVLQHTVAQQRARAGVVPQASAQPVQQPAGEPQEILTPSEAMRRLRSGAR